MLDDKGKILKWIAFTDIHEQKKALEQKDEFISIASHELKAPVIGIPASQIKNVFDRFFRVDKDDRKTYPGLGLGLFISSEIIKRHNGKIFAESEGNKVRFFALHCLQTTDKLCIAFNTIIILKNTYKAQT
jgi:signal transduction histidine kinase